MAAGRTLVITNDFPPRPGGIQSFVAGLLDQLPAEDVVVYASSSPGAAEHDRGLTYEVVRDRAQVLLPEPRVARRTAEVLRATGCDRVLFGASAPLGLLAPRLRAAGAERAIGLTHGHEAGWARSPGARQLLRRIGSGLDVVTYLGEYTRARIAAALRPVDAGAMRRLVPGVDVERFNPETSGAQIRAQFGLGDRPVVVCISRLMPRKGQDTLIAALPAIRARVPDAALLLVGGGRRRQELSRAARDLGLGADVILTGSIPWADLPSYYAAGDVFAMPCRTRRRGLDVEGLGIVYLEASAVGLPVVAGDSGGAPDAVRAGITGEIVSATPHRCDELVRSVFGLLADPERSSAYGRAGRDWVQSEWSWARSGRRLAALLAGVDPDL